MSTPCICAVCGTSPATHQCLCTTPWTFLCLPCNPQHSSSPGNHFKLPISASHAVPFTPLCESCRLHRADKKVGETWLCADCGKVFEDVKIPISLEFSDIQAILTSEILTAKRGIEAVRVTFDGLIKELHQQKLKLMAQMSREIEELEALVNEYIVNQSPDMNISRLCTKTVNSGVDLQEELQLLRYQSDVQEMKLKIPSIFTYSLANWLFQPPLEPMPDLSPPILPVFRKINTYFLLAGYDETPISANLLPLQGCTSWIFVTDEHIFLCGEPRKPAAYIMTIHGFAYNPTVSSIYRRDHPCLGRYGDHVYLFGGDLNETPQKYGERYSLSQDQWSILPNMQFPRSCSLPCLYKDLFYLLGGNWTSTGELFDPVKLRFRTLTLELPYSGFNFTVVYDQDIYCFVHGRVLTWEVNMGGQYLNEILDVSGDILYYSDLGTPVRVGDEVFFFGENKKKKQKSLFSFDLSTKKFTIKAEIRT